MSSKDKTKFGAWDILKWSTDLRIAMRVKMDQHGISQNDLARAIDVDKFRISKFFSQTEKNPNWQAQRAANLSHFQILELANLLGIDVRLDISFRVDTPIKDGSSRL